MKNKSSLYLLMTAVILLLAVSAWLFITLYDRNETIQELSLQFEQDKEDLESQYSQLALQYEDYGIRISNDSLSHLLDQERTKNQRLAEEIKTLQVNNARRLSELRKELETARSVMRSFVVQIDSLNNLNTRLKQENDKVTRQYKAAREENTQLSRENKELSEKVKLASMLEARDFRLETLNDKGRKATKLSRMATLRFDVVLSKNISASVGEKKVYLRLIKPDGDILLKPDAATFFFDDRDIPCSVFREIEYQGEEYPLTLYWTIEEYLQAGTYRADFFADGFLIGSYEFGLAN